MRNIQYLMIVFIAFLVVSCKKNELTQPIQLTYQLAVDAEQIPFTLPFDKANAVLINKTNNQRYQAKPNAQGVLEFKGIAPGTYSINISLSISAQEWTEITGQSAMDGVEFNFSADNQIYQESKWVDVTLISSRPVGNWVFKQIYFAGSNTSKGAGVRDFFIEIYNNSNETLYADSLCFAIAYGKANNNTGTYLQDNLQFDWNQSLDMIAGGKANSDYVYAKALFMIPSNGTGRRYPVAPGQSLIIAETAIDHTKPYTLNSDRVQTIEDGTLTVDLSQADFEVYMYPYEQKIQPGRTKFASDIDNPGVEDVETIFATGMRDLILNPQGKDSYVLFKANGQFDPNDFPRYAEPTVRAISESTTLYPQIPVHLILDGVEISSVIEKDRTPRRLPLGIDAGTASVEAGPYSSQSVVRKTKQIVGGRRILQDTNNSTADFGVLAKADPSKTATSFID
jgi:hypothetical protein